MCEAIRKYFESINLHDRKRNDLYQNITNEGGGIIIADFNFVYIANAHSCVIMLEQVGVK